MLGWQFRRGPDAYVVATLDGKAVAGIREGDGAGAAWTTYIGCSDAEAAVSRVLEAGGSVLTEPASLPEVGLTALCADPSGARFGLWEPGAVLGAEAVNAPGAWNFSELNTDDADGATAFYGAVFGWEVDEVDMGALSGLDGPAAGLRRLPRAVRSRASASGTPTSARRRASPSASPGSCPSPRAPSRTGA